MKLNKIKDTKLNNLSESLDKALDRKSRINEYLEKKKLKESLKFSYPDKEIKDKLSQIKKEDKLEDLRKEIFYKFEEIDEFDENNFVVKSNNTFFPDEMQGLYEELKIIIDKFHQDLQEKDLEEGYLDQTKYLKSHGKYQIFTLDRNIYPRVKSLKVGDGWPKYYPHPMDKRYDFESSFNDEVKSIKYIDDQKELNPNLEYVLLDPEWKVIYTSNALDESINEEEKDYKVIFINDKTGEKFHIFTSASNPDLAIEKVIVRAQKYNDDLSYYDVVIATPEEVEEAKKVKGYIYESKLKESSGDGWSEEIEDILDELNKDLYNFTYEISTTVKGAYTNAETNQDLAQYMRSLAERLEEKAEEIESIDESKENKDTQVLKENGYPEYKDYNPEDGWTPEDIELHKSIDWKGRNYKDYPIPEDNFIGEVKYYSDEGLEIIKDVKFIKYLRSNPIFEPYYAPETLEKGVGFMFNGNKHNGYLVMDRTETQSIYDRLSH